MVPYTVMGGVRRDWMRKYPYRLTILVMSRGDRLFRSELLGQLEAFALGEIIWVEGPAVSFDIETLSRDFPGVRFLLIKEDVSIGQMIDIGISESRAPYVLCMWSDARIASLSPSLLDSIEKAHSVCVIPLIRNARSEVVPSFQAPVWRKGTLSLQFRTPSRDGEKVLFPFDYCGIYDSRRFAQSGGYDPAISNPYWQKLDFGFRCHLWGEKISGTTAITLAYASPPPSEDSTPDESYKAFYLKNLAVRFKREMGVLPPWRMLEYILRSNTGPFLAAREFRRMRAWVSLHRSRFRRDPRELMEKWGSQ
jgi:hypothetical protein